MAKFSSMLIVHSTLKGLIEDGRLVYDAEQGTCHYTGGLSDKKVARIAQENGAPEVTVTTVQTVRHQMYGPTRRMSQRAASTDAALLGRIEDLTQRVEALERALADLMA